MHYKDIRAAIVSTVEGLTPETTLGGKRFVEVATVEDLDADRQFVLRTEAYTKITSGADQLENWMYETGFEIELLYDDIRRSGALDVKIAEDVTAIQRALVNTANLGEYCFSVVEVSPDRQFDVQLGDDFVDKKTVVISFAITHL